MPTNTDLQVHELEGRTVVCAADQDPFELGHNVFCVLTPLLLDDGRRFDNVRDTFPNRGRVWWMVRHELNATGIAAGCICEIKLERAVDYDGLRPDKDYFQARRRDATIGSRHHLEVVTLDHDPKLADLLKDQAIALNHQPTQRVMVAGPKTLIGPFQSEWDVKTKKLQLRAVNAGQPSVWQVKKNELPDDALHSFTFTANQWCKHENTREVTMVLMHQKTLEIISEKGTALDAADDTQVLNWGLKLLDVTTRESREVKDLLDRIQNLEGTVADPPGRLQRFMAVCSSATRVMQLGKDVAASVAAQPAFKKLVESNLESITKERIDGEVQERREEIENRVAEQQKRLDDLKQQTEDLKLKYEQRDKDLAEEFRLEHESRLDNLAKREARVSDMESKLEQWQKDLETRLESVAGKFRDQAESLTDQLLLQVPIWQRLGIIASGPSGSERERSKGPGPMLPAFLERTRDKGELSEADFVEQFGRVTRSHGYAFNNDDLVNVHASIKTGFWTILAGPSGSGKSSLPRFYAEALGVEDELMWLPVRPDWIDDRDVLGGFNSMLSRFEPAPSGLTERLIAAYEDIKRKRGGIYLVCLDEMNLARVEHYFAQLLSIMEQPAAHRKIELFARGVAHDHDPYVPYRRLPLGDNLRLIGTVNIDETTHFFTPKLLDRASVIVLRDPDIASALREPNAETNSEDAQAGTLKPVHWDEYQAWRSPAPSSGMAFEFTVQLAQLLRDDGQTMGHRSARRMLEYVANARALLGEEKAVDYAIAQIVLPRLKASHPRYAQLLARMVELFPDSRFPRTAHFLELLSQSEGEYEFFQVL